MGHTATADSQKDLVHPNETHFQGVPFFIQHPKPLYYTMKDHPATIECVAEPVSHAVIECAEQAIPYKGPDESGRLKVTRLDSHNRPDPNGNRWRLELQIRAKEVEEWFDSYVCRCEAWNKIVELQRPKKVISRAAVVVEAYLERKFQLEPTPTELSTGGRLELSCIPPEGKPSPELGVAFKTLRRLTTTGCYRAMAMVAKTPGDRAKRSKHTGTPAPLRGPSQSTTVYDTIDPKEPENNQAAPRSTRVSSFATPTFPPLPPPPPPTLSYSISPTPDSFLMAGQCVTPKNLSGSSTRTSASTQYFFSGLCQPTYVIDSSLTTSSQHTVEELCVIGYDSNEGELNCQLEPRVVRLHTCNPQRYCMVGETIKCRMSVSLQQSDFDRFNSSENNKTRQQSTGFCTNKSLRHCSLLPDGHSLRPEAIKLLHLAAFGGPTNPAMDYNIRVYVLSATRHTLEHVKEVELRLDGRLLDCIEHFPFKDNGMNLGFQIRDVRSGWRSRLQTEKQKYLGFMCVEQYSLSDKKFHPFFDKNFMVTAIEEQRMF
ncbi:uncharacterized protein DEA37_0002322 [Paragonimus westermani]|uniref:Uncharacterized protein n=1 Tax=Paragonimus westermani TaxID=34504 RepID=A0A5J4NYT7_9TREM|nr:uncharacterized protein DEA37_0002322 [Paragonimus westermani]